MSVERRPAFYALAQGGWRDYVTLLHLPYTLWHLSYVAIGAALAPELEADRLLWGLAAFALALGVGAHALDELHGRPLHTEIPRLVLIWLAAASLDRGRRHRDRRRARVDALVASVRRRRRVPRPRVCPRARGRPVPHGSLVRARLGGVPGAGGVSGRGGDAAARGISRGGVRAATSLAQRSLSTQVRTVRRRVAQVSGTVRYRDGREDALDADALTRAPEAALRALSAGMVALALALVWLQLG